MYGKKINENVYFDSFETCIRKELNPKYKNLNIDEINYIHEKLSKNYLDITLTLTTLCNLKCSYCFENKILRSNMSQNLLNDIEKTIKNYLLKNKIKKFKLTLFGGEPFLKKEKAISISKEFKLFCLEHQIKFILNLKTNGLIISEKLENNFFDETQITFDGDEETNNIKRISKNKNINSYKEILKNLPYFYKKSKKLILKYNFDKNNSKRLKFFLKDIENVIKSNDLAKHNIVIYLEAIQTIKDIDYSNNFLESSQNLAKEYIHLLSLIVERNFNYKTSIFDQPCMYYKANSFLITEKGIMSSCVMSFNDNKFNLGTIYNDLDFKKLKKQRKQSNRLDLLKIEKCDLCEYLPCCWGGCSYESFMGIKKTKTGLNCKKEFYDTIISEFYNKIFLNYGGEKI